MVLRPSRHRAAKARRRRGRRAEVRYRRGERRGRVPALRGRQPAARVLRYRRVLLVRSAILRVLLRCGAGHRRLRPPARLGAAEENEPA